VTASIPRAAFAAQVPGVRLIWDYRDPARPGQQPCLAAEAPGLPQLLRFTALTAVLAALAEMGGWQPAPRGSELWGAAAPAMAAVDLLLDRTRTAPSAGGLIAWWPGVTAGEEHVEIGPEP
jgi:hypothetical protein